MAEVSRNLQEDFGLRADQAAYRESEIRKHFPEAWIRGYEELIPAMSNSPKDRHVLAAAVRSKAKAIVTYNAKDFPPAALEPYSITVQGPSTFLLNLYDFDPSAVLETIKEQAAAIYKPVEYVLNRLRINVPHFVEILQKKNPGIFLSLD